MVCSLFSSGSLPESFFVTVFCDRFLKQQPLLLMSERSLHSDQLQMSALLEKFTFTFAFIVVFLRQDSEMPLGLFVFGGWTLTFSVFLKLFSQICGKTFEHHHSVLKSSTE